MWHVTRQEICTMYMVTMVTNGWLTCLFVPCWLHQRTLIRSTSIPLVTLLAFREACILSKLGCFPHQLICNHIEIHQLYKCKQTQSEPGSGSMTSTMIGCYVKSGANGAKSHWKSWWINIHGKVTWWIWMMSFKTGLFALLSSLNTEGVDTNLWYQGHS